MIKSNFKNGVEFNLSTQADLVFLLLIFFMITSTLQGGTWGASFCARNWS